MLKKLRAALDRPTTLQVFFAGAVAALALPPVGAFPVLWYCLPLLAMGVERARSWKHACLRGWLFGLGFFIVGLYWITFALTVDLARFWWLVPFALVGLPAVLGLFTAAAALLGWALFWRLRLPVWVGLAAGWVVSEYLRGLLFTGFPWNSAGYAWTHVLPVQQAAAWIGIDGLSALTIFAACSALPLWWRRSRANLMRAAAFNLPLLALGVAGFIRLEGAPAVPLDGTGERPIIRIVQPSIPQHEKWEGGRAAEHFRRHLELTGRPGRSGPPDAVIWPETAANFDLAHHGRGRELIAEALPPGAVLLTGALRIEGAGDDRQVFNALIALDDRGEVLGFYDKHHLVPFGEYVPFADLLALTPIAATSISFSSGPGPRTLTGLGTLPSVGPFICYEAIFTHHVIDRGARPQWMVNITNDAWFGDTTGPRQHLAMARMRAIEEGLPLFRAANTGISAAFDGFGRKLGQIGYGDVGILDLPLPLAVEKPTLHAQLGPHRHVFFAIVVVVLAAAARALTLR